MDTWVYQYLYIYNIILLYVYDTVYVIIYTCEHTYMGSNPVKPKCLLWACQHDQQICAHILQLIILRKTMIYQLIWGHPWTNPEEQKTHTVIRCVCVYPLVIQHSYGKVPLCLDDFNDFSTKNPFCSQTLRWPEAKPINIIATVSAL